MITAINATNSRSPGTQNVGPDRVNRGCSGNERVLVTSSAFKKKKRKQAQKDLRERDYRGKRGREKDTMRGLVSVLLA